jgi:hypothetical protein
LSNLAAGIKVSVSGVIYEVSSVSGNDFYIDRPYQGTTAAVAVASVLVSAYTSGTTKFGVQLTALADETHFKVTGVDNLYLSPVTYSTAWKLGTGSYAMISEWENRQAAIWDGVGSTVNAAFASDYGQPTKFASSSLLYDLLIIEVAPEINPSAVPTQYKQSQLEKVIIAIPNSGTQPEAELKTVFGL